MMLAHIWLVNLVKTFGVISVENKNLKLIKKIKKKIFTLIIKIGNITH